MPLTRADKFKPLCLLSDSTLSDIATEIEDTEIKQEYRNGGPGFEDDARSTLYEAAKEFYYPSKYTNYTSKTVRRQILDSLSDLAKEFLISIIEDPSHIVRDTVPVDDYGFDSRDNIEATLANIIKAIRNNH